MSVSGMSCDTAFGWLDDFHHKLASVPLHVLLLVAELDMGPGCCWAESAAPVALVWHGESGGEGEG